MHLSKGTRIYSDRYLTRCLDFSSMKDKTIILFDDSLNDGKRMFYFYAFLKNCGVHFKGIIPVVYNLSLNYDGLTGREYKYLIYKDIRKNVGETEEACRLSFNQALESFHKDLKYSHRIRVESFSRFSISQTAAFQNHAAALVMNLPVLKKRMMDDGNTEKAVDFTLSGEQFELLKAGNAIWKYSDISYADMNISEEIHFGFFQLGDKELLHSLRHAIHDLTVKCKYNVNPADGSVKVTFVPFALVKSMGMLDVYHCFCRLFYGTNYYKRVEESMLRICRTVSGSDKHCDTLSIVPDCIVLEAMKRSHEICCALYRSIIYYFSMYISHQFKRFVYDVVDVMPEDDMEMMSENFEAEFIETIREIHGDMNTNTRWGEKCRAKLMTLELSSVLNLSWMNALPNIDSDSKMRSGAAKEKIDNFMKMLTREHHSSAGSVSEYNISFEEIASKMDQSFSFGSEEERRYYITWIILRSLEISILGNDVSYEDEAGVIRHDFRPGENSDIYCGKQILYVYAYFYAAMVRCGMKILEQDSSYNYFLEKMEAQFIRKGYFDFLISKDNFNFYKDYFSECRKDHSLENQIRNKSFMLDDYFSANAEKRDPYISEAFQNVSEWMEDCEEK